jgi:hypothetical protein
MWRQPGHTGKPDILAFLLPGNVKGFEWRTASGGGNRLCPLQTKRTLFSKMRIGTIQQARDDEDG